MPLEAIKSLYDFNFVIAREVGGKDKRSRSC